MDDFEYDKKLFIKYCANTTKQNYDKMNKTQLIASLTIDYHRIEKGLAMQNCRPNFGHKSRVLKRLYDMNKVYIKKFGTKDKILKIVYYCILEYYHWHKKKKIKINCNIIEEYLKKYSFLIKNSKKVGGIYKLKSSNTFDKLKQFDTFFRNRRSVRMYSKKQINDDIIKKCIYNALYGTPTVCNRPINKVYIIKETKLKQKVLSLQNGNRGFGMNAPIILIITTCLENFQNSTERRQPYIGGGMFCMSLIYALHAEKLATCCLNWDVNYKKNIQLKKILNIPKENVIMYISVGHYPDNYEVAFSDKPDLKDVMKIM